MLMFHISSTHIRLFRTRYFNYLRYYTKACNAITVVLKKRVSLASSALCMGKREPGLRKPQ